MYGTVNGNEYDAQLQSPPLSHNGSSIDDASVINSDGFNCSGDLAPPDINTINRLTDEVDTRPVASGSTYRSNFHGLNNLNVASTDGAEAGDSSNTDTNQHFNHFRNQLPPMIISRTTQAARNTIANTRRSPCPHQGCDVTVRRASDLPRHILLHSPPHLDCTVGTCNRKGARGFRREDKLRDHLRQGHGIVN